jgi:cysteine desulfurase
MVYLDNHATTRLDERVLEAMTVALTGEAFGNPSSTHQVGVRASRVLEGARGRVAELLPGRRRRVVFTSGATEANALAVLGRAPKGRRRHVVVSAIEHPSVLGCARELERRGCELTVVSPGPDGVLDVDGVLAAVSDRTALLAVMLVNNEVGTLQPAAALARRVKAAWPACHVHVDAVQAVGLVELAGLDAAASIAISGHKIHGPKGIGALAFDERSAPRPLWQGGGQEGGVRPGTQDVAGAAGLARALELALEGWDARARAMAALRDRLVAGVTAAVSGAFLVGHARLRSPANAMIAVPGLTGDALVGALDRRGVVASTGSACHAGDPTPSTVLRSMGHDTAAGTVRLGLSRETTGDDVERAIEAFVDAARELREVRRT